MRMVEWMFEHIFLEARKGSNCYWLGNDVHVDYDEIFNYAIDFCVCIPGILEPLLLILMSFNK